MHSINASLPSLGKYGTAQRRSKHQAIYSGIRKVVFITWHLLCNSYMYSPETYKRDLQGRIRPWHPLWEECIQKALINCSTELCVDALVISYTVYLEECVILFNVIHYERRNSCSHNYYGMQYKTGLQQALEHAPIPGTAMMTRENATCPIALFAVACIM